MEGYHIDERQDIVCSVVTNELLVRYIEFSYNIEKISIKDGKITIEGVIADDPDFLLSDLEPLKLLDDEQKVVPSK